MRPIQTLVALFVCLGACAHSPLSPTALDEARGVAIVARIEDEAGPRSTVFRDDITWRPQLEPRRIDDKEADRRLAAVLANGTFEKDASGAKRLKAHTMSRFELADTLRSGILGALPNQHPWTHSANPASVASMLESFLVQEVPANAPDYLRLVDLGVDTVVEIVIEGYGMHAKEGRAGVWLAGTARLFRIGGAELYHRSFICDDLTAGSEPLDPFAVARNASLFTDHLRPIIAGVADQIARDLTTEPPRTRDAHPGPKTKTAAPPPPSDDPL